MSRQRLGVLALAVALTLVLVMPKILSEGVPGTASAAPLPAGPAVGSCVVGWPSKVLVVDCGLPHDGEVVELVAPKDVASPMVCGTATESYVVGNNRSEDPNAQPVGSSSDWEPPALRYDHRVILAPDSESVGDWGWRACMVVPVTGDKYVGTIARGMSADPRVPDAYRTCLSASHEPVSCSEPHRAELLGQMTWGALTQVSRNPDGSLALLRGPRWLDSCEQFGSAVVGGADPSRSGTLSFSLDPRNPLLVSLQVEGEPFPVTVPVCKVTYVGPTPLVGSVVSLGDQALPVR